MEIFSHFSGALWEEFKALNYFDQNVELHEELFQELRLLHEICEDHFACTVSLPKAEIPQQLLLSFRTCEFIPQDLGIDALHKETIFFKSLIEKLTSILLMTKEQGMRYIQTCFTKPSPSPPRLSLKICSKGYNSSLNSDKLEAFLISRFTSHLNNNTK